MSVDSATNVVVGMFDAVTTDLDEATAEAKVEHALAETQQEADTARLIARKVADLRINEAARLAFAAEKAAADFSTLPPLISLAESLALPEEDDEWRIAGLLPSGGNATLIAPEKAGKTTLVGNLVRALVDGTPFLGRFDVQPLTGRVAILNYEVTGRMFTRWLGEMNIRNTRRVTALHLRGHPLPLLTDSGVTWLADKLRAAEVEVLVVDPFGAAYASAGGTNESDNSEVRAFLTALDRVKQLAGVGELLMPVHAKREARTERGRGASVLQDWPDALWSLTVDDKLGNRFLSARGRDVAMEEQQLRYDPATRRLGLGDGNRAKARAQGTREELLAWLVENPGATTTSVENWGATNGVARGTARATLATLVAEGRVAVEEGPNRSKHHSAVDLAAFGLEGF